MKNATTSTPNCDLLQFSQVDLEWTVKINRISLQLLGLWPEAGQISREKLRCNLHTLVIFVMFMLGIIVPYTHSLLTIRKNIMQIIEDLQFLLPAATCVIRLVIFWWKKEGI